MSRPPAWPAGTAGLLTLPSGRTVRGRSLRAALPPGPLPTLGVYLSGRRHRPPHTDWPLWWIEWPDFRAPRDPSVAAGTLARVLPRCDGSRVEIGCDGGVGRTGTALAALCILDGLAAPEAVSLVRTRYHRRAVETWMQRRFLAGLAAS